MPTYERFACNKLVRDLVITEATRKGFRSEGTPLQGEALKHALIQKLREECEEVAAVPNNPTEILKELADLAEVIAALAATYGFAETDIHEARQRKNAFRGAFTTGTYLSFCDVPVDHPEYEEFASQPHKYLPLGKVS